MEQRRKSCSVECWMCGCSSTDVGMDEDGMAFTLPMVNCDACGCLLDREWLQSRAMKVSRQDGWENTEVCRKMVMLEKKSRTCTRPAGHRLLGIGMAFLVMMHISLVYAGNAFILFPDILFILYPTHDWLFRGLVVGQIVALGMFGVIVGLFWSVILKHPGKIPIPSVDEGDPVLSKSNRFMGYSWCQRCDFIKPPDAHHCRRCGICVYKMDHHCMYTANTCIGQDNLHHFIYFLRFLVIGSGISSSIAILYAWVFWDRLWHSCSVSLMYAHHHESSNLGPFHYVHVLFLFATNWMMESSTMSDFVWLESFVISLAGCFGSFMLLHRQMRLQSVGTTYLKTLISFSSDHHDTDTRKKDT